MPEFAYVELDEDVVCQMVDLGFARWTHGEVDEQPEAELTDLGNNWLKEWCRRQNMEKGA